MGYGSTPENQTMREWTGRGCRVDLDWTSQRSIHTKRETVALSTRHRTEDGKMSGESSRKVSLTWIIDFGINFEVGKPIFAGI